MGFDSAASREEAALPHQASGGNQPAHAAMDIPDNSVKARLSLPCTVPDTYGSGCCDCLCGEYGVSRRPTWQLLQVEVSSSSGVSSNRLSSDLQRLLQPGHHPAVPSCLSPSGPATSDGQPGDTAPEQAGPAIPESPFSQPATQDAGNGLQSSPSFLSYHAGAGPGLWGTRDGTLGPGQGSSTCAGHISGALGGVSAAERQRPSLQQHGEASEKG